MAYGGSITHYLQQVERVIQEQDGDVFAQLISFRHPHVQNVQLQDDIETKCQSFLESPYDEMVAAHLRCVAAQANNDIVTAYGCQTVALQSFLKIFQAQKEENWCLPVLKVMTLDLRMFALAAESHAPMGHHKPGEMLEKAAEQIMSCFRVCVSDNRTQLDYSKRWGTLSLVNQLFKIYFKINKLHLCKPLIRAIDSSDIKDRFWLSELVTYKYFVGKKAIFDSEFKKAAEYLEFAFDRCHMTSRHNKRLILIYLIPMKMLLGQLPKKELLAKYNLDQFSDVAQAVRYLIRGTHQLNLKSFERAMKCLGENDVDSDEVQCIVANLIDKAYIRGYISHQHQKLVVSKQNSFPPLSSVLK